MGTSLDNSSFLASICSKVFHILAKSGSCVRSCMSRFRIRNWINFSLLELTSSNLSKKMSFSIKKTLEKFQFCTFLFWSRSSQWFRSGHDSRTESVVLWLSHPMTWMCIQSICLITFQDWSQCKQREHHKDTFSTTHGDWLRWQKATGPLVALSSLRIKSFADLDHTR